MAKQFTPRIRSLAADIKDITSRLTSPEIRSMLARLDLSRVDHQIIAISLHGELDDRNRMFAQCYLAEQGRPQGPGLVSRVIGWARGLLTGRQRAVAVPS